MKTEDLLRADYKESERGNQLWLVKPTRKYKQDKWNNERKMGWQRQSLFTNIGDMSLVFSCHMKQEV